MATRLSIVVPVHDVEPYLAECLDSIAAQTMEDFECVMVDDGSTDGSAAIAEKYAAADSRFRLHRQPNRGLGAARNAGFAQCRPDSRYLAFMDSDDTVPPDAYRLMTGTLDETGSDFASGNVTRFRSVGAVPSALHRRAFATTALRTHLRERPELIIDRTAWNKVYRREFWDRHGFRYPEGILYEDAPVSLPGHFAAAAVDVLSTPVYNWREREGGNLSITQRRIDPRQIRDRIASIDLVRDFLLRESEARPADAGQLLRIYHDNLLNEELLILAKQLPAADEEYRTVYLEQAGALLRRMGPEPIGRCLVSTRVKMHLTAEGRLDELLELFAYEKEFPGGVPVSGGLRARAAYPFLAGRSALPPSVARLDRELVLRTRLDAAVWDGEVLRLDGRAYTKYLGAQRRLTAPKAVLLREQGSRRGLLLRARSVRHPSATAESGQSLVSCAWAGFETALDVRRLRRGGRWVEGTWRVTVAAVSGGRPARSRLKAGAKGSGACPPAHWVAPDVRIVPQIKDQHLYLAVERVRVRLTGARPDGDAARGFVLDLALAGELPSEGAVLVLTQANSGRRFDAGLEPAGAPGPDGTRAVAARIPAGALTAARGLGLTRLGWDTRLHLADGTDLPVVVDERADCASVQLPLPPGTLHAKRSPQGYLQLTDQPAAMVLHSVDARTPGALELELSCPGPRGRLVLQRDWTQEELTVPLPKPGPGGRFAERFQVLLPLHPEPAYEGESLALAPGDWQLLHRPDDPSAGPDPEDTPVLAAPALHRALPVEQSARGARTALDRVGYDRVVLTVHPPLDREADSAYGRRRLRTTAYPAALRRPLRAAVLFDNFKGGPYGDSPWAIHREMLDRGLELEHLWAVRGPHVAMPPSARPVLLGSAEWHEALARSRYVVGSTHFPPWIRRREGQVIVQTWHGTPLKRIGFDFGNAHLAGEDYLSEIEREAPHWSLLLSPNRFSTPLLRRAFRYRGEVLESGYPRNDLLYAEDREKTADAVRRRLGVPRDRKVVLYAPTWREDRRRFNGGVALDLCLDLAHAERELGRDHVLLIRPHTHVVEKVPHAGDGFVRDVAGYPDITELLLIADVLITDYSSLMFDYAHTGRPMLFFTYDLEWYRDTLRGFYLDFEREAPGPLLSTSAEVVGALRDLGPACAPYADAYAAFRERYCDLDDGRAAARVVDRMLELAR